ncbi:abscisic acid 8'-hydroxylase 3 [Quercus suber]|uniref:Abscisic acid 8'-hydroxylase 3 n=1 Tax=Quercus suber TaxID=58331 RepID=A0AAW0LD06_QUESU
MDSSMLQTVVLLSTFVLSAFFLLKSQASPKEMEQIPGSMGWPIVGESFSFLSDFSSPSGVYNFMKKRQQRYGKVFKTSVMGKQVLGPTSLLQTTGEMHKRLRRLIAEPLSLDGLKNYFQFINMLAIQTLDQWPGRTVFVLEEASTFTLKVIGNMIMSLEPIGEEQEKFRANFKLISSSFASLPFKIPGTAFYRGIQARDRINAADGGGDDENKLTDTQLKDNILTLLVAALDIEFNLYGGYAEEHRQIQANRKDGEYLTWSELNKMPFTAKVISETLRRATILPWFSRKAAQDFEIDGYNIKKGWSVNLDVVSIHHDPEVFPDPQKFDPSRFDEPLKPFSFLVFGSRPRMCPGINLAKLEISIFIHYLVRRYKWRALEKDDSVQPTLVRMPKNNAPVDVRAFSFLLAEITGFAKRNGANPRFHGLAYCKQVLGPTSLLQTTGELHKRLRRLIAEPLSLDGLKNYFQFINMLAIQTLDQWPGRTVFVLEEASTFTLKVIGNMIMSLDPIGEEQEKFRANFRLISSSFASLPFRIPGTAFYRGIQARDRMYAMLDSIISKRRNGEGFQQDFLRVPNNET